MIESAPATETDQEQGPKPLRLSRSYYLRPEQVKALDEACFDLAPVLREKLSPSKVLERLIDRKLADYIEEERGAQVVPARGGRKRRNDNGGAR